jgi:hypothetical protein
VTRTVRKKKGRRYVKASVKSAVAVFIITSLDAREAAPQHLAGYVRGHWTIENKVPLRPVMSPSVKTHPGSGQDPARGVTDGPEGEVSVRAAEPVVDR